MKRLSLSVSFFALALSLLTIVIWRGEGNTSTKIEQRQFTFSYQLNVDNIPPDAKTMEIWIPFPQNNEHQKIVDYKIKAEHSHEFYLDPDYGNKIIDFNFTEEIPEKIAVELNYTIIRVEDKSLAVDKNSTTDINSPDDLKRFLEPNKLVPIDGKIADEARKVADSNMLSIEKVKAVYDYLHRTMKYDKSGEGWGQGDAVYACDFRKGNCTDIHSLFIGMLRSIGIPARFIIGFPLPEKLSESAIAGYHCWAEFYIEDMGWVPVDISEAIKHPDKKEYFFGHLDANRVSFTTGRDIKLSNSSEQQSLNYFIYPFIQIDSKPFKEINYSFSFSQN
ncbi:MAG: transglutaminase-like domain-containing protein [Candidatus Zixiibacteriota bacterium]